MLLLGRIERIPYRAFLSSLLASTSLLLASCGVTGWIYWVCLAAACGVVTSSLVHAHVREVGVTGAFGSFAVSRALLLATAVVLNSLAGVSAGVAAAAAGIVLLVTEQPLASAVPLARPGVIGLPGAPRNRVPTRALPASIVCSLLATALALVAAAWPPTAPVALAATAVGFCLLIVIAATTVAGIRDRITYDVRAALEQYEPRFLLYWDAGDDAQYQIGMWLPYLDRVGAHYLIVTRTMTAFDQASTISHAPVLLRRSLVELDELMTPHLRAVFYVNNAARNTQMVRYHALTHVQLLHGDSDKASSYNPIIRMYDYDFVAGQAAIDRFARNGIRIPEAMFRIVGRPQVEGVAAATAPIATIAQPVVLYAPTWSGLFGDTNYSSLECGTRIVELLLARGCTVLFRPHPFTDNVPEYRAYRESVEALLECHGRQSGRSHVFGESARVRMTVNDCLNASDAMIADVSAIVGDYLFSGKPFAMTNSTMDDGDFAEAFPVAQAAYLVNPTDIDAELDDVLDDLLRRDPKAAERHALRTYYLGDFDSRGYADHFVNAVRDVIGAGIH